MRVLFSNAPWHHIEDGKGYRGIRAGSRWPHTMPCYGNDMVGGYMPFPFFLATAAALTKEDSAGNSPLVTFDVKARDSIAMGESYDDFYSFFKEFNPDVIVMETSTPSLENDLKIAQTLKENKASLIVIFTGMHFELEQEEFLKRHGQIDFTVYGEYERPVYELLKCLKEGNSAQSSEDATYYTTNVLYRKEDDSVIKTGCGELAPLSELPWPERDDFPFENYYDGLCGLERPQLQMVSTRGCPFKCIFCVWPQIIYKSNKYRMRTPEDVVNEMEANLKKHNYKSVYIDDDTFNVNKRHVLEVARLIKERDINIPWAIMARADLMDEDILNTLKDSGLYSLKYGVESSNQAVLDEIGKRLDLDRVKKIVYYTKEIGIKVHLTFTFGLPSDTKQSIEDTIEFASTLPADTVQFSIATPFPGTVMYDMYDKKGWINTKDWTQYDGSKSAVSRTERFSAEELEAYVNKAYNTWAEAAIRRHLIQSDFGGKFREKIDLACNKGDRVLVLQSANHGLTKEVLRHLTEAGMKPHLLLHERFVWRFSNILDESRMHVFNNTGDFKYDFLRDFAEGLRDKFGFNKSIVPYSNANGCGYEEVEKVAISASGSIICGVTLDGNVIEKG